MVAVLDMAGYVNVTSKPTGSNQTPPFYLLRKPWTLITKSHPYSRCSPAFTRERKGQQQRLHGPPEPQRAQILQYTLRDTVVLHHVKRIQRIQRYRIQSKSIRYSRTRHVRGETGQQQRSKGTPGRGNKDICQTYHCQ